MLKNEYERLNLFTDDLKYQFEQSNLKVNDLESSLKNRNNDYEDLECALERIRQELSTTVENSNILNQTFIVLKKDEHDLRANFKIEKEEKDYLIRAIDEMKDENNRLVNTNKSLGLQ